MRQTENFSGLGRSVDLAKRNAINEMYEWTRHLNAKYGSRKVKVLYQHWGRPQLKRDDGLVKIRLTGVYEITVKK